MQQRLERDLARRWASGELIGLPLRTTGGERLTVLYPGRPGGGAGPDFRDAVIRLGDARTLCGDVELHVRGGSWRAHGHTDDRRYQSVILHVVYSNDLHPTRLPDGQAVPMLALADVVAPPTLPLRPSAARWPCQHSSTRLDEPALLALLEQAGLARFLEKAAVFQLELATVEAEAGWSIESMVLFRALAEGMGYGRERQMFRTLGEYLASMAPALASPAAAYERLSAHLKELPRLDRQRLAALCALAFRWRERGPWPEVWALLALSDAAEARQKLLTLLTFAGERYAVAAPDTSAEASSAARSSAGRATILVWNVILPFAYAWAQRQGDAVLAERARWLALELPGLPSNQITRAMQAQLLLPRHPKMALAQQGLQHVYRHWCRMKRCAACPCAQGDVSEQEVLPGRETTEEPA